MVTMETAEKALKTVYLGVVANQLNVGVNPFLSKIKQTSQDVWGKEIVKLVPYGINGGIGAGSESGNLPASAQNNYERFRLELKNLYGTIELSDKAIRASQNSVGAFVNLLEAEMEGLLTASKFNLGRMLYGDGSGKIATVKSATTDKYVVVDNVNSVMEGMVVDVYSGTGNTVIPQLKGVRITQVDRENKRIYFNVASAVSVSENDYITVQGSKDNELTGLEALFSDGDLYGLSREGRSWLKAKTKTINGATIDNIQSAIDEIEEVSGGVVDIIMCSYSARRDYISKCASARLNLDYMNLDGGFKAVSYNGIPLVADRFIADGDMYILNSKDFKIHQLCDWRWLEGEGGKVIKQIPGSATYSATLVKYADMICDKPIGQYKLHITA